MPYSKSLIAAEKSRRQRQRLENDAVRKHSNLRYSHPSTTYGFPTDFVYFRRMIGNPLSKLTGQYQDMAPFQVDYHNSIQDFHWVIPLKSRKLGATETAITSIALNVFDRYTGHDSMIVAGNELRIAKEILLRFHEFFEDKNHPDGRYAFRGVEQEYLDAGYTFEEAQAKGTKYTYDDLIRSARLSQDPTIEFTNDARVFAFAASKQEKAQTFRGPDDVICILVSEAAHTGMKNDQPIMNALEPNLAQRDDADFILESTGNGKRGFYYEYWMQIMTVLAREFKIPINEHQRIVDTVNELWKSQKKINFPIDWFPLMWDYKVGVNANIISKKFIEKEKRNPKIDFAQEYEAKFTSTYTQAIDVSNLQYIPEDEKRDVPKDLLELIGKKSAESNA